MSFESFQEVIGALAKANGVGVVFRHDTENGRFIANSSDGLEIVGNPSALKLTLKNGRHHTYQVPFADLQRAV